MIDGVEVGKTPWEGIVAPGTRTVLLRGEGDLGTQPVAAPVSLDEETVAITLNAEALEASARIEPNPAGALVAVDGASVGRGVWEGRLRAGVHRVEVTAGGVPPRGARSVTLAPRGASTSQSSSSAIPLSPLWGKRARGRFGLELVGSLAVVPSLGGDMSASCTGTCTWTLPRGGLGIVRAVYEPPPGARLRRRSGGTRARAVQSTGAPAAIVGTALRARATAES